ncbi:hypothetical protein [Sulfurisphaera tokodaii]|uniref:Uncharacterized protein n=1 Tax=Sulfurisphaera tokodaii (strain DSM 16993 / JCM 10545 / NBRC 100140 / 7) TaxID=273063 RepID=Q972F9_SULTO|nr:hypothetical protein [Sulfurisphaera tokodaii]BAB66209.1 hypothetical protein STK_11740 [Sulfurisphaera tokodaii str. 7]
MVTLQELVIPQIPSWIKEKDKRVISKTLEIPIGGTIFYFDIPENPLVYVSETRGVIYINGSSYWDLELTMFKDLRDEFVYEVLELAKTIGKDISNVKIDDVLLETDNKKHVEKRKFYIKIDNIEAGFYYNLYLPDGIRNGIIEIIPYYKQV